MSMSALISNYNNALRFKIINDQYYNILSLYFTCSKNTLIYPILCSFMKHICSKSKFAANRRAVNLKSGFILLLLCCLCYFVCYRYSRNETKRNTVFTTRYYATKILYYSKIGILIVTVKPPIQIYRAPIHLKPRFLMYRGQFLSPNRS